MKLDKLKYMSFLIIISIFLQVYYTKLISDNFYRQVEKQRQIELKQKVDMAYNTILPIIEQKRQGKISKEDAIKEITTIVRRMTYRDEYSNNYIFMSDYNGTYLVQPFEPSKEGTNQWNYQDIKGKYVIRELVKAAKEHPEGSFVSYYLYPPNSQNYEQKLSYVRGIPEIEAYIGTGMYIQTTFKMMFQLLNKMKISLVLILIFSFSLFMIYIYRLRVDNKMLSEEIERRKVVEAELVEEKKETELKNIYLNALFENSPDAIAEFDENGLIVNVNKIFEDLFKYKKDECINKNLDYLIAKNNEEILSAEEIFRKGYLVIEGQRYNKYNKPIDVIARGLTIKIDGKIVGGYAIYTDITKQKKYEKKLEYMSFHDALTGLYNSRYFYDKIINGLDIKDSVSILMADVNGLKLVNDTMGHFYGDKLLKSFTKILMISKRKEDLAFRIGGDEFVLVMPNTPKKEAERLVETLNKNIEKYNNNVKEKILMLSVALGLAEKANVNQRIQDIMKEADDNMYKKKLIEKASSKNQILNVLLAALGEKDYVTRGHTDRVKNICIAIAEKMNLNEIQKNNLILLSQMHDLGKVAIPDEILNKKEPLTKEEWEILKTHPERGYRIAISSPELAGIADYILKHHERWDGNGYPFGLKADEIPLECRILAIADAYDAMTSLRPYNKQKTPQQAIEEIKRCSGTQFDPQIADIFTKVISVA
ncbi:Cyclic di-GMP phosphodiesterase response regulator RpfG [Caloramator mitchellensis]|uniref:Cyclic di-GMP phosphodiesterase response regulator RpfG n=1 Tax=Caloramator mitchellensis TaxID=908809 RepID=A0A0R3JS37_CALMK|nr:HD domain-containing phosphohydrolase [Caloramator mitchellensis]KRQ86304.1 Cyclic di-GMP phosphodiesterase response regulator RpfG [Caloramator mitchellensis]